ncbi:MAG: cobyrinate a,c-diamide synthase [Hornefia sp.]|nr:cobyrinate a,c-diamide synthase [Hornefia sp.]
MKEKKLEARIPRILIGGTGSDCGKTTVTCGLLSALKNQGRKITSFKCGPDYIDPMFHSKVLGTKSRNLDIFLCGEETVKYLLARDGEGSDLAVIEGVMGLYDGRGFKDDSCSANHVAKLTETPAILVVNIKGKGLSLAAEIKGYMEFMENTIAGVILNNCSLGMYSIYKELLGRNGIKTYGYLPRVEEASIGSRHLGLVTAEEVEGIKQKMDLLGQAAAKSLDLGEIIRLAESTKPLNFRDFSLKSVGKEPPVKIGIARDKAFCFYYEDVLELLEGLGAELSPFSPTEDEHLPKDISGLILGGGYPELHIEKISQNKSMLEEIRLALKKSMPVYAECGGFMYLGETIEVKGKKYKTVGAIKGNSHVTKGLVRFGYKELKANVDNLLCKKGEGIKCHEFHYSDTDNYGEGFTASNGRGKTWTTGILTENMYAGYPHLHLWGNPGFAKSFVRACRNYRR